jgi:hypothetical protein
VFWKPDPVALVVPQALVSFKKYKPPPFPFFKVNICPFLLPHFASIFFAYCDPFADPIISLHSRYIAFKIKIFVPMQIIKICSTPNY